MAITLMLAPTAMESPQAEARSRGLVMHGGSLGSEVQGFCASKKWKGYGWLNLMGFKTPAQ